MIPESNGRARGTPGAIDHPEPSAEIELEDLDDDFDEDLDDDSDLSTEIAFTPRQILGGFALLAALILLLRRRSRRS